MKKPIPGFTTDTKPAKIDTSGGSVPKTPSQPITSGSNGKTKTGNGIINPKVNP